jgi:outer membrane lipoprotein SlyB
MHKKYVVGAIVTVVAVASTVGGVTVSAMSGSGGGNATGPEADAAAEAALAIVGNGSILEVEHGDDEGATWEVEIRKDNGEELEVLLDGQLNEVAIFPNDDANEGPDDDDDEDGSEDSDSDD